VVTGPGSPSSSIRRRTSGRDEDETHGTGEQNSGGDGDFGDDDIGDGDIGDGDIGDIAATGVPLVAQECISTPLHSVTSE